MPLLADDHNPLIPAPADAIWSVIVIVWVGLVVTAFLQLSNERGLSGGLRFAWMLAIFLAPFVGAIAWMLFRSSLRRAARDQGTS